MNDLATEGRRVNWWISLARRAEQPRCPECGAFAIVVGRDVLTGDERLACDGYRPCGWRSHDERGERTDAQPRLFGDAA